MSIKLVVFLAKSRGIVCIFYDVRWNCLLFYFIKRQISELTKKSSSRSSCLQSTLIIYIIINYFSILENFITCNTCWLWTWAWQWQFLQWPICFISGLINFLYSSLIFWFLKAKLLSANVTLQLNHCPPATISLVVEECLCKVLAEYK